MIDVEPDMISGLPGNVIDVILSYLPIREAVRTSVLSKQWKNSWHTLPNLVFDGECMAPQDPSVIESKFFRMVYNVLLNHSGPINLFEIEYYDDISQNLMNDIDQWILHLAGRSIKELSLLIYTEDEKEFYKIPWCLFSCQCLHRLKLNYCWLKPPKMFEGFKHLKSLYLTMIRVDQNALENLISSCPLLEELTLMDIDDLTEITIHAPNLNYFYFWGNFESITFDNTLQLATISINLFKDLDSESNQSRLHGYFSNLLKFFDHRPHIQSLTIGAYFLKYLTVGVVPIKLPTPCNNLRSLSLCINFYDLGQISAAICLLRSSPNLQNLEIFAKLNVSLELGTYCWEDKSFRPDTPIPVRQVTLHWISGIQPELDFIKFLLLYSPVLEKMIVKHLHVVRPELVTELIRFKRLSEKAEVIYSS
ncbi:F-box/FBD/LRR-repeat protein At1g13570-like [Vicia villosa]|uniref:F-box/FBD/LRR-repeat protein At1g13570-like n=1 Tax=Vicia villosa TaxID=3911 RepID=UPI00273ADA37|nr:F-box/FBD/LRR-repeat protein At1g13570-like [Vicia villosa]